MTDSVVARLGDALGDRLLERRLAAGDSQVRVAPADWRAAATLLRDDPELAMDHFIDLTAVDYPERAPAVPRFDVVLFVRSSRRGHRIQMKTRVGDGEPLATLSGVWGGADWAEREIWDLFGIPFDGHPDLRRILLYQEFEGHPLRKDYPIERTQPLVPYRDVEGTEKIYPFGLDEGQPFGRIDWNARLEGRDHQVSPAIARQVGQRRFVAHYDAVDPIHQEAPPTAGVPREGEADAE